MQVFSEDGKAGTSLMRSGELLHWGSKLVLARNRDAVSGKRAVVHF